MERNGFGTTNDEIVIRNFVKLNPDYAHRVSVLNTTWNVGMTSFNERYSLAEKPIKVVHFHPDDERQWDCMGNGNNDLNVVVVNERLKTILDKYKLVYEEINE